MLRWARKLWRVRATALGTAVALVASVGVSVAAAGAASAAGNVVGCPTVALIGARGSGEKDTGSTDGSYGAGQGPAVQRFYKELTTATGSDVSINAVVVPYKAAGVSTLIYNTPGFLRSVMNGSDLLYKAVQAEVQTCPTTQNILVGYSQGAMALHQLLNTKDAQKQNFLKQNIIGAVLIADGDRSPGAANSVGTALESATGIRASVYYSGRVSDSFRTIDVCDAGDLVCDFSKGLSVVGGFRIHTHNYSTGKATSVVRAAELAATWIKPPAPLLPLKIGRADDISSATIGVPFTWQLTASGGTPPYTWAKGGNWPAWLTVSPDGLLSGTPTATGPVNVSVLLGDAKKAISGDVKFNVREPLPAFTEMTVSPETALTTATVQHFASAQMVCSYGSRVVVREVSQGSQLISSTTYPLNADNSWAFDAAIGAGLPAGSYTTSIKCEVSGTDSGALLRYAPHTYTYSE